jgi:hypothetical protein
MWDGLCEVGRGIGILVSTSLWWVIMIWDRGIYCILGKRDVWMEEYRTATRRLVGQWAREGEGAAAGVAEMLFCLLYLIFIRISYNLCMLYAV